MRGRVEGKRIVPYWSRADIESGKAAVEGKAVAFVDDPVEAFFLQIQGSGRIRLAEGGTLRLGYADQNGHPFRSIARALIDRGAIAPAQASMQGIKAWARTHPEELPALLNENPSYVFFRELSTTPGATIDGPIGTLGVPLAAGRTIAVDPHSIPLGAPVFLATTWPLSERPLPKQWPIPCLPETLLERCADKIERDIDHRQQSLAKLFLRPQFAHPDVIVFIEASERVRIALLVGSAQIGADQAIAINRMQ